MNFVVIMPLFICLQNQELELKVQRQAEDVILMKNMKSQLMRMPELEKEVDILRTHNINLR